jgi:hypothetical protein
MKLKRSTLKIIANYHLHAWKIALHMGLLIYWWQKALGPLSIKLYGGYQIEDLISGFAEPLSTGLENIFAFLKKI